MKKETSISGKGREGNDTNEELKEPYCDWSQEKEGQKLELILKR